MPGHKVLGDCLSTAIPQRIHKEIRLVHTRKCTIRRLFYCLPGGERVAYCPHDLLPRFGQSLYLQCGSHSRERARCLPVPGSRQFGCWCALGAALLFPKRARRRSLLGNRRWSLTVSVPAAGRNSFARRSPKWRPFGPSGVRQTGPVEPVSFQDLLPLTSSRDILKTKSRSARVGASASAPGALRALLLVCGWSMFTRRRGQRFAAVGTVRARQGARRARRWDS